MFQKVYKGLWEQQREKGFELHMDSLSILTAKAKTDLASSVSDLHMPSVGATSSSTVYLSMANVVHLTYILFERQPELT